MYLVLISDIYWFVTRPSGLAVKHKCCFVKYVVLQNKIEQQSVSIKAELYVALQNCLFFSPSTRRDGNLPSPEKSIWIVNDNCQLTALTVILTACISTQADFSKYFQETWTDQTGFCIYYPCILIAMIEEVMLEMPTERQ